MMALNMPGKKNTYTYYPGAVEEILRYRDGNLMIFRCMSWFGSGGMSHGADRMNLEQLISVEHMFTSKY